MKHRPLSAFVLACAFLIAPFSVWAEPLISYVVTGYQLVKTAPASAKNVDYVYTAYLYNNTRQMARDAQADLKSPPGAPYTVIEGSLRFGDVKAKGFGKSLDTFTLRTEKRLNEVELLALLRWRVSTGATGNVPPLADAGPDQTAAVGATVSLSGAGSSDPNGDPLAYAWTLLGKPSGSQAGS